MCVPHARLLIALGTPTRAMRKVAKPTDLTRGAKIMQQVNITVPKVQTSSKLGLVKRNLLATPSRLLGGRGVNFSDVESSPGLVTNHGSTIAVAKPIDECMINAVLPTRPTWLRASSAVGGVP